MIKKENKEEKERKEFLGFVEPSNLNEEKSISVNSLASLNNENITFIDEGRELTDRTSMTLDWQKEIVDEIIDTIKMKPIEEKTDAQNIEKVENINNTIIKDPILAEINIHNIIKKFDEQNHEISSKPRVLPRAQTKKPPEVPQKPEGKVKPLVPPRSATTKLRGRLDKSHSTPAYDLTEDDNEKIDSLPVLEKTKPPEKLPDVIPEMPREPELCPFTETGFDPRLPFVEAINLPMTETQTESVTLPKIIEPVEETKNKDVPPKPPPRNFIEVPKPAYPTDSPKPVNLVELTKNNAIPPKQVFEFPDSKRTDLVRQSSVHSIDSSQPASKVVEPQIKPVSR
ncbi:hypothetical protein NQ314_007594 [Rhamnusium bicolor]|uniref:Uncharacterized protein n=1 Tax=Rhamnusium bicolor TaxID=1586634 RepID=A0AAV8YL93_9CUCU|nr:hypothetical protein NQ314_007594 [Rhamnusium bicolor]